MSGMTKTITTLIAAALLTAGCTWVTVRPATEALCIPDTTYVHGATWCLVEDDVYPTIGPSIADAVIEYPTVG